MNPLFFFLAVGLGGLLTMAAIWIWVLLRGVWKPDWMCRLSGEVPWANPRSVRILGNEDHQHDVFFVSRHEVAEVGLYCPICNYLAAERGDLSMVKRMIIDGSENEVIICKGVRLGPDDQPRTCGQILAAAPDTEHGDHLNDDGEIDRVSDCPPEFYRFVRIAPARVLAEKYGIEINADRVTGELRASGTAEQLEKAKTRKDDIIPPEQVLAYVQANGIDAAPSQILAGAAGQIATPRKDPS